MKGASNRPFARALPFALVGIAMLAAAALSLGSGSTDVRATGTPFTVYGCYLGPGGQCPGVNLAGLYLTDAYDFRNMDLTAANLAGIDTHILCTNSVSCQATGVFATTWGGSDLAAASFANANVRYNSFQNVHAAGANFRYADNSNGGIFGSDLRGADLTGLKSTTFSGNNLTGADLTGATVDPNPNTLCNTTMPDATVSYRDCPTLTVTALNRGRFYGDSNGTLGATISGLAASDDPVVFLSALTCTSTATSTSVPGSYPINCAGLGSFNGNYRVTYVAGSLTVVKRSLTVAVDNATKASGAANPAFTSTLTGMVAGDNLSATYTTAATAASGDGSYAVTPGLSDPDARLGDYSVTYIPGTLYVGAGGCSFTSGVSCRGLNAPGANPGPVNLGGSDLSGANLSYSYFGGGRTVWSAAQLVGTNFTNATLTQINFSNTNFHNANLHGANLQGSFFPGASMRGADLTLSDINNARMEAVDFTDASLFRVDMSLTTFTGATFCHTTMPDGSINDSNCPALSVTASGSREFGQANPTFIPTWTGFLGTDDNSVLAGTLACTTTATPASPIGSYPVTCSGVNGSAAHYKVSFVAGTLTVVAPVRGLSACAVKPNATCTGANVGLASLRYLDLSGADFSGAYLVGADLTGANLRNANLTGADLKNALLYGADLTGATITAALFGGAFYCHTTLSDGTVSNANCRGTLTATPVAATRVYGDANPALTAGFTGFVGTDTVSILVGNLNCTSTAIASSPVGTYPITCAGLSTPLYTITYSTANLTVTPAALTVTGSYSRVYGAANPTPGPATLTGLLNGDAITATYTAASAPATTVAVGSYTLTPAYTDAAGRLSNYTVTANLAMDVTPATLTATGPNGTIAYDSCLSYDTACVHPAATYSGAGSISGAVNGDTFTVDHLTNNATSGSLGPFAVRVVVADPGGKLGNYAVNYADGTLTVLALVVHGCTIVPNTVCHGVDLSGVNLGGVDLTGADLTGANLTGTNLAGARLAGINLSNALLVSTGLTNADLSNANLGSATLFGIGFYQSTITGASLVGASLTSVYAYSPPGTVNGGIDLTGAKQCQSSVQPWNVVNDTDCKGTINGVVANATRVYGAPDPAASITYSGFVGTDTAAILFPAAYGCYGNGTTGTYPYVSYFAVDVHTGPGTYTWQCGLRGAALYKFGNPNSATLTITRAPLTITGSGSRQYGHPNPTVIADGAITGAVAGDVFALTLHDWSFPAVDAVPGSYPLYFGIDDPGTKLNNYQLTYSTTFTVSKADLIADGGSGTLQFDQCRALSTTPPYPWMAPVPVPFTCGLPSYPAPVYTAPPALTGALAADGLSVSSWYNAPASGTFAVGATVPLQAYVYDPNNKLANYNLTTNPGSVVVVGPTINGCRLEPNASCPGVDLSGHELEGLKLTNAHFAGAKFDTSNLYQVDFSGSDLKGASFQNVAYAALTVGSADVRGVTLRFADTTGGLSWASTVPLLCHTVEIWPSGYTYTDDRGCATLTGTPASATRVYGAPDPGYSISLSGFVGGDTAAVISGTLTCSSGTSAASPVGSYAVTCSGLTGAFYSITYVSGTLVVTPAALTITASDASRPFAGADPTFTGFATGLLNGDAITVGGTTPATATSPGGTYSIVPVAIDSVPSTLANYTVAKVSGTLTITPATPTLSWTPKYLTPGQGLGADQLNALASVLVGSNPFVAVGTYVYTPGAGTTLTSGDHPLSVVFTPSDAATFNSASRTVSVHVAIPQIITFPALTSVTYGVAAFAPPATSDSGLAVSLSASGRCTITSGQLIRVTGAGSCTVTATQAGDSVYDVATPVTRTLTISPAALTVTTLPSSKSYGAGLPAFSVSVIGLVNGDSVSGLSAPTFTTAATAASHAGAYDVTPGGSTNSNYLASYVAGTLSIQPVGLSITADSKSKAYGAALPALTVSYSGFVNADGPASLATQPAVTSDGTSASHVGSYLITPSGAVDGDYTFTYHPGTLAVNPVGLSITADDKSRAYGAPGPALTVSYAGFVNGEGPSTLATQPSLATVSSSSHTGTYPITASGAVDADYTITYHDGTLTVNPAVLTIIADDKTKAYGAAVPPLTLSYSGFVNGEGVSSLAAQPTLATAATAASHVGAYAITPSGAAAADYAIGYQSGTLSVNPVGLSINADDKAKAYGAVLPALTVTYSGFVNGDSPASLTTPPVLATVPATSHVGTYPITAGGAVDPDYSITYGAGTLTVAAVPLQVMADSKTRAYGTVNPLLTAGYVGFVNGDGPGSLAVAPTLTTSALIASHVIGGPYPITASGAVDADYDISYTAGSLAITPAPLHISADSKTKVYGAPMPALTAGYSGLAAGDTADSLAVQPVLTTRATAASHRSGNPYPITVGGALDPDYTISYSTGALTVVPAPLTITADSKVKVAGSPMPALTASLSGLVNGDRASTALTSQPLLATTATATSPAGAPYPITVSAAIAPDYAITFVPGTLTVEYVFRGFYTPSLLQSIRTGDSIVVSFGLFDIAGHPVTTGTAHLAVDGAGATPAGTFNTGDAFRYFVGVGESNANRSGYRYLLATSALAPGVHLLSARVDDGTVEQVLITVSPRGGDGPYATYGRLTLLTAGLPALSQPLTVAGAGFLPGSQVRINFGACLVATVTAGGDGTIEATFTAPLFDAAGFYSVTATGGAPNGRTLVLIVTVNGHRPGH